jgi:ankyrin repeat protein
VLPALARFMYHRDDMRRLLLAIAIVAPVHGAGIDFNRDVKPIFREYCWACHGPTQQMATLRLDQREAALIAGRGKMAIMPGGSDRSLVYRRVAGIDKPQMPPTGPLTPEQIGIIKDWLDQGAQWPVEPPPHHDWQPDPRAIALLADIRHGNFAPVRGAVKADPKLARARDEHGFTLLMQAALYAPADEVKYLLAQGADPNAADLGGITPLMLAVQEPGTEKVRALFQAAADPNAHSIDGRTAVMIAADRKSSSDTLRVLIEQGAKSAPEPGQIDPLVQVARNGDLEAMKVLARARDGNYPPAALASAAQADCMACLKMILDTMPSKTAHSDALRAAAVTSRIDILAALLDAGADPNAKGPDGQTALMRAAYSDYEHPAVVKLLLDHGADAAAVAGDGDSVLKKAERKGRRSMASLLGREVQVCCGASALSGPPFASDAVIRAAVQKSLALLQPAGESFWKGSGCISCHQQSLPAMTIHIAREHGFAVDETAARAAVKLASDYLDARRERLLEGISPPGGIDTTSYIVFGLAAEHAAPTEAIESATRYLKVRQADDGSFPVATHRPPLEFSTFTITALVMRDLLAFAPAPLRAEYTASVAKAAAWLASAQPQLTEEYAFKILGLAWGQGSPSAIATTAVAIAREQRPDGGWSQLPTLQSDAYATGQVLVALEASGMKTTDPVFRRGVEFLLRTQLPDGSWHVKSRAETVQIYFESGYPHGVDQFISVAGASWATTALALTQALK